MPEAASTIANIVEGHTDDAGVLIERVYSRVSGAYAIYRTARGVIVQFADDPSLGSQQRQALAQVNPLRAATSGVIDGWRNSADPVRRGRGARFDYLIAAALGMALQGDVASAKATLVAVNAEIVDLRTSVARTRYVMVAGVTTFVLVLVFTAMMTSWFASFNDYDVKTNPFWAAAAIGAIGAWFSIALAIRGRTIHTDLQSRDNDSDALLRVMIGAISAAVLLALLRLGLVNFAINGKSVTGSDGLIVVAFAAGFSERLVSDFLTQSVASALRARGSAAVAAAGLASPQNPPPPGADEQHPLGQPPPGPPGQGAAQGGDTDDADACGPQGLNVQPADQTADQDLPPATGGVAGQ